MSNRLKRWGPWLLGAAVATLALLAALPPGHTVGWTLAVWLIGAVALEATSPQLPTFGPFHLTTAWTLASLADFQTAPVLMGAALGLWWLGRTVLAALLDHSHWPMFLAEWLPSLVIAPIHYLLRDLPPVAWAAPARWVLSLALYFFLRRSLARYIARRLAPQGFPLWLRMELTLYTMRGLALLGALGFVAGPAATRWLFWPLLYGFYLGAANTAFRVQAMFANEAMDLSRRTQANLRQALVEGAETSRALQATAQDKDFLQTLAGAADLASAVQLLAARLRAELNPRSLVLLSEDLEPLSVSSPEASHWQGSNLTGLGRDQFREVLREGAAQLAQPPILEQEPAALILPLPGPALLYVGRQQAFSGADLRKAGGLLAQAGPVLQQRLQVRQQGQLLMQAQQRSVELYGQLEERRAVLDCAYRFSGELERDNLWLLALEWLQTVFQLEGAALCQAPGTLLVQHGPNWSQAALEGLCRQMQGSRSPLYLAAGDRPRWPTQPGPFSNVVALPLHWLDSLWLVAFSDRQPLTSQQLEILQGVAELLGLALGKAHLYREVLLGRERIERSQEMWLQTHKSLALAQMSAGVAHELNTPLGSIRLALEAALPSATQETAKKRLTNALSACSRAQQIILRLGQLAETQAEELESHDVVQILRLVCEQLPPLPQRFHIDGPAHLLCRANRADLENLLVPLLVNALEAVEGQPAPEIAVDLGSSPGEVWWQISDNGPGIPTEILARVCEPFFTTKKIGKNVGLGLALAEQTCRRLGGRLEMGEGPGGRVRVVLPGAR